MTKNASVASTIPPAIWIVTIGIFILRYLYSTHMPLVPDEAYYWDWTRYLAAGYFDHPPMIAWLLYTATHIFGNNIAAIKLVPALCSLLATLFLLKLATRFSQHTSSLYLLLFLFNATIISGVGTTLVTPDIPLILFWAAALYLAYRALYEPFSGSWFLLGLAIGAGLLSKYTFGLFPISLAILIITDPAKRKLLLHPAPWITVGTAAIIFLPNIIWNAQHGWPAILFQFHHGVGGTHFPRFDTFGEYLGGQIGVATPFLFILLIATVYIAYRQRNKIPQLMLLILLTALPLTAFGISSLQKRVEANWPAMAYLAGMLLIVWLWDNAVTTKHRKTKWIVLSASTFGLVVTLTILTHIVHPILPLPPHLDTTLQARGWQQIGSKLGDKLARIDSLHTRPITANRYQQAAIFSFYLPGQPRVLALNIKSRTNHYALLPERKALTGQEVIFLQELNPAFIARNLSPAFENFTLLDSVNVQLSRTLTKTWGIYSGIVKPGVMQ